MGTSIQMHSTAALPACSQEEKQEGLCLHDKENNTAELAYAIQSHREHACILSVCPPIQLPGIATTKTLLYYTI